MLTPAQQNTAALMQALSFSADELLLNRAGQLSPAQIQRAGAQMRSGVQSAWTIALVVLVMFVVGFFLTATRTRLMDEIGTNGAILAILVGILLFWGLIVIFALTRGRRQAKKGTWPVFQVSGRVKVHRTNRLGMSPAARAALAAGGQGVADATIQIGRTYVAMWGTTAELFVPGNPYTVYYIGSKRGGLPVSAEALEEGAGRR